MKTKICAKHAKVCALFLSGIALAIQIPSASAVDVGIGATHQGQGNTVLIPIKMDVLIVEPEVSYSRAKQNATVSTAPSSNDSTSSTFGLATGVYYRQALGPLFEGYFGGRVGIATTKTDQTAGINTFNQKSDSWFIGPTAGLQHYFSKQFAIALDVGLIYQHTKQKFTTNTIEQNFTTKQFDTQTRILLRGYF